MFDFFGWLCGYFKCWWCPNFIRGQGYEIIDDSLYEYDYRVSGYRMNNYSSSDEESVLLGERKSGVNFTRYNSDPDSQDSDPDTPVAKTPELEMSVMSRSVGEESTHSVIISSYRDDPIERTSAPFPQD